jgi:hypothetical protein
MLLFWGLSDWRRGRDFRGGGGRVFGIVSFGWGVLAAGGNILF